MKTRVCPRYFANHYLWKQFVNLRPTALFELKVGATNLQKGAKMCLT